MIRALSILVLLIISLNIKAQDVDPEIGSAKHYVYINPGALLHVPAGIQIGYDRHVFKNARLDVQGGFLVYGKTPSFSDFNATERRGMRYQASLKNYLSENFYFGPMVLFKRVTMNERMWVERYEGSYLQVIPLKRYRRTWATGIDFGWRYIFDESGMMFEICYGLGLQSLKVRYEGVPNDGTIPSNIGVGNSPGTYTYPFINFGIKFKYPLGPSTRGRDSDENNPNKRTKTNKSKSRNS